MAAQRARLSDGRWHFQHGPIDLLIGADGDPPAVALAHRLAWQRFWTVLQELVAELAVLRQPLPAEGALPAAEQLLRGPVAQRMWNACVPYRAGFITPMAAVAGAVAEELVACYRRPGVRRAWINNGGDIALHLIAGQALRIGLFADLGRLAPALADALQDRRGLATDAQCEIRCDMPVRGVATSGWRGRSFSLGIADSVTVLAASAAGADAAATVIANAVDVADPGIVRRPSCDIRDDSDLGAIPVTVAVPCLGEPLVRRALAAGLARAEALRAAGLIWSATLVCQGRWCQTAVWAGPELPPLTPALDAECV